LITLSLILQALLILRTSTVMRAPTGVLIRTTSHIRILQPSLILSWRMRLFSESITDLMLPLVYLIRPLFVTSETIIYMHARTSS
jgi:hypothetical protein